jgi:hypothetical protein
MSNSPVAFNVYSVIEREGKDPWWLPLGAAFWHTNQTGLSVVLQGLPLPGPDGECRLVLRPPKADADDGRDKEPPARQDDNRRRTRR